MELHCDNGAIIPVSNKPRGLLYAYFRFLGDETVKFFTVHMETDKEGMRFYKKFVKIMHSIFDGFPRGLYLETSYNSLLHEIEVSKIVRYSRRHGQKICKGSQERDSGAEEKQR